MSGLFLSIAAFVDFSRGDGRRGASSPRRYVDVPSGSPRTYAVFARSLPFTAGINCAGDGQVRIYITVAGKVYWTSLCYGVAFPVRKTGALAVSAGRPLKSAPLLLQSIVALLCLHPRPSNPAQCQ